jgi:M6 family metalloprotease-like protein
MTSIMRDRVPVRFTLTFILLLAATAQSVFAAPAAPFPFEEIQPDGTRISLHTRGDEHFSWLEDRDGYTVIDNRGRFEYATLAPSGFLTPSGLVVGRDNPRAAGLEKRTLPSAAVRALSARRIGGPGGPTSAEGVAADSVPPAGAIKNLVVMIRFADHASRPLPTVADMDVLFNAVGGHPTLAPTGSVRDVYLENSYGQMTLNSYVNPGVGDWITVSGTEQYYANGKSGDSTLWQALREALDTLDNTVDFRDFDSDNDGRIDSIAFIHSGYGAEWGGTDSYGTNYANRIWSHRWAIQPQWNSDDGVSVFDYHISPGVWGTSGSAIGRIGVIAHETGHFFGLPDLYDTDGNGSGIGSWGLMANSWDFSGSQRCPPHFSPWSKINLGWYSPTVISQPGQYTLNEAEFNPEVFRIDLGFPAGEYLLLENRQDTGFDCSIPQGGVLIWHIDDTTGYNIQGWPGQVNWPQNGNHYRVAVLQADGGYDLERDADRGDSTDAHHGAGVDAIGPGPGNHPNTDTYRDGIVTQTGITISDISASGPSMTFCLNGCNGLPAPADLAATAQSATAIHLAWTDHASDEDGFEVQRSLDGAGWSTLVNLGSNTEQYDDTGLAPLSTRFYRVRTIRGAEQSAWSPTASATTFDVPPMPPASLTATAISASAIDMLWADSANNEDGYRVERSLDGANWGTIASKGPNTITHSDSGLAASTDYFYRVAAFNSAGDSGFAEASAMTAAPPPFVDYLAQSESTAEGSPSADFAATHEDDGFAQGLTEQQSNGNPSKRRSSLDHSWAFNVTAGNSTTLSANAWSGGSADNDSFLFEWSEDGAVYLPAFTVNSTDSSNLETASLPPTLSGTVYVRVTDTDNGQGNSATDSVFVDYLVIRVDNQPVAAPAAPSGLQAPVIAYNRVDLTWVDNASDETGYEVQRATDGVSFVTIAQLAADAAGYSDSGVGPEGDYSYRVRALKGATVSDFSNEIVVTTPAQPAGSITLTVSGYKVKGIQHADLAWSGAVGVSVDIRRGTNVIASPANSGAYTDNIETKGGGTYSYQVCNAGTEVCSDRVEVVF